MAGVRESSGTGLERVLIRCCHKTRGAVWETVWWALLKRGTGYGVRDTGYGVRGTGYGVRGTGNGENGKLKIEES